MKAIVFEEFGEPSKVLSMRETSESKPKPGTVVVRMQASPINPSDIMVVRGRYGRLPTLPATPGFEGTGVVEAAGPGLLGKFLVGKRVAVLSRDEGLWREKAVVTARQAIPLSSAIPLEQAAMFFVNPATAYIMTRQVLRPAAGQWLLQTAAGSALGKMVIRLGKRYGFRTLNIVRRDQQVAELKAIGADAVFATDGSDLVDKVRHVTGGAGVPFAIDPVGGAVGSAVVRTLAPGGKMLVYGTLSNEPLQFSSRDLMTPSTSIHGFWLSNWMAGLGLISKLSLVRTVGNLIKQGILASEVGKTFPLERIADAVREAEAVGKQGKVLLRFGE